MSAVWSLWSSSWYWAMVTSLFNSMAFSICSSAVSLVFSSSALLHTHMHTHTHTLLHTHTLWWCTCACHTRQLIRHICMRLFSGADGRQETELATVVTFAQHTKPPI